MANLRIMVVVCVSLLLVSFEFGECTTINYPDLGANGIPKQNTPPNPANEYHRGCNPAERCRPGGKRLLSRQPEAPSKEIWNFYRGVSKNLVLIELLITIILVRIYLVY